MAIRLVNFVVECNEDRFKMQQIQCKLRDHGAWSLSEFQRGKWPET